MAVAHDNAPAATNISGAIPHTYPKGILMAPRKPPQDQTPIVEEVEEVAEEAGQEAQMNVPPVVTEAPGTMTTTNNFMNGSGNASGIEEVEVEIIDNGPRMRQVRVIDDIGPVYIGAGRHRKIVEMKQGTLYSVPEDIYSYLQYRRVLVGE